MPGSKTSRSRKRRRDTMSEFQKKFHKELQDECAKFTEDIVNYFFKLQMDETGQTEIHLAAEAYAANEFPDHLFDAIDDVNHSDNRGVTYFHIACYTGNAEVVRKFVDQGVDVNLRCSYYHKSRACTPLLLAQEGRHVQLVKFLLKKGADPGIANEDGYTLLNLVCRNIANPLLDGSDEFHFSGGHSSKTDLKILRLLLKSNCNANERSRDGESPIFSLFYNHEPLHSKQSALAFCNKQVAYDKMISNTLELLLKHGADINEKNPQGITPLQMAVNLLNYEAVKLLVERGANIQNIQFDGGYLDPDCQVLRNRYKTQNILAIIELLKEKGYEFTKNHYMSILHFLIGFECVIDINLFDILTSGSPNTIRHSIGLDHMIPDGTGSFDLEHNLKKHTICNISTGSIYYHFIRGYLEFIEAGQMYIDRDIKTFLLESLGGLNHSIFDCSDLKDRYISYVQPLIKKSEKTMIGKGVSILDLCKSNPEKTFKLLNECDYKSVVNAGPYQCNFKFMADIIDGYVVHGLVRGFFLTITPVFLQQLTNLPNLCCMKIVKYLKNEDLLSMCKSFTCKT